MGDSNGLADIAKKIVNDQVCAFSSS